MCLARLFIFPFLVLNRKVFKLRDIYRYLMRRIILNKGRLVLQEDEVLGFIEKRVTRFGTSAKVDCPKQYIGKRAYVVVCKD